MCKSTAREEYITCYLGNIASYPGNVSERKMAWYPLFAHARKTP